MAAEQFVNNALTTLNGAVTSGATSLTVQSASGFPAEPQFRIVVDGELMLVTALSGATWTVTRGIENTTAAAHASGAAVVQALTAGAVNGLAAPGLCQGRLTLTSGTPVTTSDVASGSTVYFTPYLGNRVGLFDGTQWRSYAFAETGLALSSLSSGVNYDVFLYDSGGAPALELTAWSSDTGRDTTHNKGLVLQDGVYVRNDDHTRRYLGTIRTISSSATTDTVTQRFVWNYYNRQRRALRQIDTTSPGFWTYNSTTWRQARGSTSNQVAYVVGQAEVMAEVQTWVAATGSAAGQIGYNSVNEDSTSTPASDVVGAFGMVPTAGTYAVLVTRRNWYPALGYHYTAWLEKTDGSTVTFNSSSLGGMTGWVEG
jgi:hypothetical protein